MDLRDRHATIVGGASGVGSAPARELARVGAVRAAAKAVCIVAATFYVSGSGTANEDEGSTTRPPHHPYLAPAQPLTEMEAGDLVERAIARSARALFSDLAKGSLPTTDFGTIALPSFSLPYALLFHETDGGTLVEKREIEFGIRLDDLTPDEKPGLEIVSRPIPHPIAMASTSAIRRALRNVRPQRSWALDGVSYYFFSRDGSGRAHSPDPDTEAGQLVRLVTALREFADGQLEERELRVAVEHALRANHGSTRDR